MIITRLAGGIGNQMFHYAIARANQRSDCEQIVLDTRQLQPLQADIEAIVQRPFALGIFPNLKAVVIDSKLSELMDSMRLLPRARRQWFKMRTQRVRQTYLEPVEVGTRQTKHLWLEGNFQSEAHFEGIRNTLLRDFEFPKMDPANEALKARMLGQPHALSIHLRRGDYLSSSNRATFTSVTLDYYKVALRQLVESVAVDTLEAFVFSDDIDWVRENFTPHGLRLSYVTGNDADESWKDISLMSCCRHHIIANSSFSWWGAWLSQRDGQKLAPRHWFAPNTYPFRIESIVPKSWKVIDYELL